LTSQGFLYADADKAQQFFNRAKECFEKALAEEPKNEVYRKSLEMTERAPSLHAELQKQLQEQQQQQQHHQQPTGRPGAGSNTITVQPSGGSGGSERSNSRGGEQSDPKSDFWYDLAGWGILSLLVTGIAVLSRGAVSSASR
jgi:hypothetical protein